MTIITEQDQELVTRSGQPPGATPRRISRRPARPQPDEQTPPPPFDGNGGSDGDGDGDPRKVSFNLIPAAHELLEELKTDDRLTYTRAMNLAVQLLGHLRRAERGGAHLVLVFPDGTPRPVRVLNNQPF